MSILNFILLCNQLLYKNNTKYHDDDRIKFIDRIKAINKYSQLNQFIPFDFFLFACVFLCICCSVSIIHSFVIFHCRYPAKAFVGDTFCYLSGMTFAVVGILGHFSKTLLLFFIPQIVNFLYSVPQLFHFVPCPRHRMPRYNAETDLLESSKTQFRYGDLNILGRICVTIFRLLRIIEWNETEDGVVTTNNFTLINLLLILFGPQHEQRLTYYLLGIQVFCTLVAFVIRYPLAKYFYEY